jgi:choline dehydrogenase
MSKVVDADEYDYVVVGAGSAGAALAGRLTTVPSTSVVLLEAGGVNDKPEIHVPAAFAATFKSEVDWDFQTTRQDWLSGRSMYWPRGKVLGGSSSINLMMWVRGFAADYDRWAELAGPDWSYQALLPYFRRIEAVEPSPRAEVNPDHGTNGAMMVSHQRSPRSHTAAFLAAAVEVGLPLVEANRADPEGVSLTMVSQRFGSRFSTADGYLFPAADRPNLVVRTGALAHRVLFEGTRAVGVEYSVGGRTRRVMARREVVLSGGVVNTPQLLMLSGIGERGQLEALGIDVLVDAPEVGENLRDHLGAAQIIEVSGDTLFGATSEEEQSDFAQHRRGMLTSVGGEAYGFAKSDPSLVHADIEILFVPAPMVGESLAPMPSHGVTVVAALLQPRSRGTVRLSSTNPAAKPIIDPRYLSDPADRDTLLAGMAWVERIVSAPAFAVTRGDGRLIQPSGADGAGAAGAAERATRAVDEHAITLYHPTSTARMGNDAGSVVDPELRVRGVQGLRVADASVMPEIIRGHTNAPSILIGERAADFLRASAEAEHL